MPNNILDNEEQPLNDPSKSLDYAIDNRDLTCTWLRIQGSSYRLDINPIEMFKNTIENNVNMDDEDVDTSIIDDMIDWLNAHRNKKD